MARKFQFNWKVSLFAGICLLVFLRLGLWQLDREQDKIELIADRAAKAAEAPLMASELPLDALAGGARAQLTGAFDQSITLLRDMWCCRAQWDSRFISCLLKSQADFSSGIVVLCPWDAPGRMLCRFRRLRVAR